MNFIINTTSSKMNFTKTQIEKFIPALFRFPTFVITKPYKDNFNIWISPTEHVKNVVVTMKDKKYRILFKDKTTGFNHDIISNYPSNLVAGFPENISDTLRYGHIMMELFSKSYEARYKNGSIIFNEKFVIKYNAEEEQYEVNGELSDIKEFSVVLEKDTLEKF